MKYALLSAMSIIWLLLGSLSFTSANEQITFWTTEMHKERLEIQQVMASTFTRQTGVHVRVVPVRENQLAKKISAAEHAGTLPDVILHPVDYAIGWAETGILDVGSATKVINHLGKKTFAKRALRFVRHKNGFTSVPVDGWGQLLLYRKDLFNSKGLKAPNRWNLILEAAEAFHDPPRIWGFDVATDSQYIYMQQIFEHFALSNGVRLTDAKGKLNLNTPEMIQTLVFYKSLHSFTPRGNRSWPHTRKNYFFGKAAMTTWSPYILDELAGIREGITIFPDIASGKKGYLAENTGFVAILKGPKGAAQYGQINYLGITHGAKEAYARKWVTFILNEGYLNWLGMSPEGKLPMRKGTREKPKYFRRAWMELELGSDSKVRMSESYLKDNLRKIVDGVDGFDRWGFSEGQGALMTKIYSTKIIPAIIKQYLDGEIDAAQAAAMMDEQVKALQ